MENHAKETTKEGGLLATAARKIGAAAGVVVSLTGAHQTAAPAKIVNGKFPKKDKTRLPRRLKKHLKKTSSNGQPVGA